VEHQYLIVTGACNLECSYCWYSTGAAGRATPAVKPAHIAGWIERCNGITRVRSLTLTGGEPLIRRDLPAFLDVGRGLDLDVCLLTNGTLLTERLADRLRDLDVEVHITLDSVSRGYHDSVRGGHRRVMRGLRLLAGTGVPRRSITTVVTRGNIAEIEPLREFAAEHGFGISFHPAALPEDHPLSLVDCPDSERVALLKALRPWAEQEGKMRYLGLTALILRGDEVPLSRCPVADRGLVIDSDGRLHLCYQQRTEPLGSIFGTPPADVLDAKRSLIDRLKPASCIKIDCLGMLQDI